ncbi:MAG: LLM class flavin-dependent oxidoreductase [Actinomycetota bacterium]
MRLGLALWPDRDVRELAEMAVAAENAGFDDLWWPDHYDAREVSAVLTLCAARTTRIRLGTAVTSPLLRHPGILGSLFASLSEASDGRAVAGLGPGGFEVKTNLKVTTPSPIAATREAVVILRALLAGERVTIEGGRVFPVESAGLTFAPPSPVPIYLAGRGPNMLALAGEIADGLITHGLAVPYIQMVAKQVDQGVRLAGRSVDDCDVALMLEVALSDDVGLGRDALRPRCLYMVGGEYAEELIPLYGLDPEAVKPIRAAVRAGDRHAVQMIDDEMVDAFAIAGPPERVVQQLTALSQQWIRTFILSPGKGVDAESLAELGRAVKEGLT